VSDCPGPSWPKARKHQLRASRSDGRVDVLPTGQVPDQQLDADELTVVWLRLADKPPKLVVALVLKVGDQVPADEPAHAGDEDTHAARSYRAATASSRPAAARRASALSVFSQGASMSSRPK
jgi:hypothetical protein